MSIYEQAQKISELADAASKQFSSDPLFSAAMKLGTLTGIFAGLPDTPENRAFLAGRIASLEKEIYPK